MKNLVGKNEYNENKKKLENKFPDEKPKEYVEIKFEDGEMERFANMIGESIPIALKFFENPQKFFRDYNCKIYLGYGLLKRKMGKIYILVKKVKINKYFVLYFNTPIDTIATIVVDKEVIQKNIEEGEYTTIDKEIFSIWLEDQKGLLIKQYDSYLKQYNKEKNGT